MLDLSQIEVPQEYNKYYSSRVTSFFERIQSEYGTEIESHILENNLDLGTCIIRNEVIEYDLETTLTIGGYKLFGEVDFNKFSDDIDDNESLRNSIVNGNVLIGYVDDFKKAVLVTKSFDTSEVVHEIIH